MDMIDPHTKAFLLLQVTFASTSALLLLSICCLASYPVAIIVRLFYFVLIFITIAQNFLIARYYFSYSAYITFFIIRLLSVIYLEKLLNPPISLYEAYTFLRSRRNPPVPCKSL